MPESESKPLTSDIPAFRGKYGFLSNMHMVTVALDGILYPSAEHAFQAAKTLDPRERERICAMSLSDVKRVGHAVTIRPDWKDFRLEAMHAVLSDKFTRHSDLTTKLLATGDAIIQELNTWGDTFWGISAGRGHNHLGLILMDIRHQLGGSPPPAAPQTSFDF